MSFSSVIFDLDGTLVDSLPGIELSARYAVQEHFPGRELPSMRELIGPPIRTMFSQLWPQLTTEEMDRLVATFRLHYDEVGCRSSVPYPEVGRVLEAFASHGLAMFVLTNKPSAPTATILDEIGVRGLFRDVISPDSVQPSFTRKSAGALMMRDRHSLLPQTTLLVGDGRDDLEAATACGFAFAAAAYGYGKVAAKENSGRFAVLEMFSALHPLVL